MLRRQRRYLGLILIAGCALAAAHLLWLPQIVVDDAYISYRYALNLAHGRGLVFNPGERVEGFSNCLWVALCAAGILLDVGPVAWSRAAGAVALLSSVVLAAYLARRVSGSTPVAAGVALILASSTALCGSAVTGLETGLFTLLVTATLACVVTKRFLTASFVMGMAALTRPEGVGLCLIATGMLVLAGRRRCTYREVLRLTGPCVVMATAYVVFRLSYFGEWLPNSVLAKSAMFPLLRATGASEWPWILFNREGTSYVLEFLRYSFGVWVLFGLIPLRGGGEGRFAAVLLWATVCMGMGVAIYNFGDWMTFFRLLSPYLPALTILVVWGMANASAWVGSHYGSLGAMLAKAVAAGLVLAIAAGQFHWRRPVTWRNPDRDIAEVLAASHEPDLLAATEVLGRLGYYAPAVHLLDMAGLTDRHIARHGEPRPPFGRVDFDYVLARDPHLIMNNVAGTWIDRLDYAGFSDGYWWVDRPAWTRPAEAARMRPRFVFVRRGTLLEREFRSAFPEAVLREPRDIAVHVRLGEGAHRSSAVHH